MDERTPLVTASEDALLQNVGGRDPDNDDVSLDRLFFVAALVGAYLAMADESLVMATNEEIGGYFQRSSMGPWLLSSYNLGYCLALPVYGHCCRIYGYKEVFLAAYTMFALGSLITGGALSMSMLLGGRFIAGAAGSGLIDVISMLINDAVSTSKVAVLRSHLSLACMVGVSSGAPLGGLLMDTIGWRCSFLGQVPIILLCMWITAPRVPAFSSTRKQVGGHKIISPEEKEVVRLDILGLVFLALSVGSLLALLQTIEQNGLRWEFVTISLSLVLVLATVFLAINELVIAQDPFISLDAIKQNGCGLICALQLVVLLGQFSLLSNVANFYVRLRGVSNTTAGVTLVPLSSGFAIGSLLSGYIIRRTKRYKTLSIISLGTCISAYTAIALIWHSSATYLALIPIFLAFCGTGSLLSSQFVALCAGSSPDLAKKLITLYYLSQQIGMILGVTTSATLSMKLLAGNLKVLLKDIPDRTQIIREILNDSRYSHTLPDSIQTLIRKAYLESFQSIPLLCLGTGIVAIPIILSVREHVLK